MGCGISQRSTGGVALQLAGDVRGGHERAQRRGHRERRGEGHPPAGGVLQRDHRPRVDRLALREQKGLNAPRGLRGGKPLQRARVGRGAVRDGHRPGVRVQGEREARPQDGVPGAEREGHLATLVVAHGAHVEVARVEVQRALRRRDEVEGHRRVEDAVVEVNPGVPVQGAHDRGGRRRRRSAGPGGPCSRARRMDPGAAELKGQRAPGRIEARAGTVIRCRPPNPRRLRDVRESPIRNAPAQRPPSDV